MEDELVSLKKEQAALQKDIVAIEKKTRKMEECVDKDVSQKKKLKFQLPNLKWFDFTFKKPAFLNLQENLKHAERKIKSNEEVILKMQENYQRQVTSILAFLLSFGL